MAWLTRSSSSAEKFANSIYGATVVATGTGAGTVGAGIVAAGAAVVGIVVVATRGGSMLRPELMSTAHVLLTQSRTCNAD